jgi:hypothetical protein
MQHHPEQLRKARKEKLRAAQLAYLDQVEQQTRLTPSEIAREIESDPSTLTRFKYKAGYNGTLSDVVIAKTEARFGIPAPQDARAKPAGSTAMLVAPALGGGLSEPEAEPYQAPKGDKMADLVTAAVAGRVHVVPWTLRSRALEDEGYLPGDVLIVDLNAEPEPGDIVCAQLYDFERAGGTRTVFRLYHPPFLVGAGKEEGARVPQLIDSSVGLKGVVEVVIRSRRR